MTKNLSLIEEIDFRDKIVNPFFEYVENSLVERKKVARDILMRSPKEILLIDRFGFSIDSVFAGLNEIQIEYFVKKAPISYKKELVSIMQDKEMMNGAWEIIKAMDEDEGDGSTKNQDRMKKIIQYIQDNRVTLQS